MIDYDAVHSKFIKVARDAVGSLLSQDIAGGTLASVIKSHLNSPLPKQPYVVVDILEEREENGWLTHESVNEEDNPYYQTNKLILLNYRCYGKNALSIISQLHGYFRLPQVRDDIRSELGAGIVELTNPEDLPTKIGDKNFVNCAEFNIITNIVDTLVDTSTNTINSTNLTGELFRAEGDPSPLPIEITIP